MANYMAVSRTNYFRVTDEERYKELFNSLSAEDLEDYTKEENGIIYHGFGAYDSVSYVSTIIIDGEECEEYNLDKFFEELQKILPEDEAFMYFEVGHEKLRYVVGMVTICTKTHIKYSSLDEIAIKTTKELLGENFKTQIDY